jgi:dihydroorotase
MLNRREFSKCLLAGGPRLLAARDLLQTGNLPPSRGQSSDEKCDLVIKGGTVIDPGQQLHALLDVAVKDGRIFEVAKEFPEVRARSVISAKNRIVTPGFIDLHVHCFDGVGHGINADHYCLGRGVTTAVDAGSTGYLMVGRFVKDIVNTSITRVYALVHIGILGAMWDMEHRTQDLDWVNPELTAKAAEDNKRAVVGIKVHLNKRLSNRPKDLELVFLKSALEAAESSHLPLMVHATDTYYPLSDILKMMRRGDIFTHCYNNYSHNILDANGKVLPEAREARERGVFFDVGEGPCNLSFDAADKCLQQDFLPDSISTDMTRGIEIPDRSDLPTLVSKFMALGMDIDQAIDRVTAKPAMAFNFEVQVGSLRTGSQADISILELREGKFDFVECNREKRKGTQMLINKAVVCRGEVFVNQA